jgi:glycosyltransferase involved in cell wall biosynthesis
VRAPEALAQALIEVCDLDEGARSVLGNRALQRIIDRYSLSAITRHYENVYRSVIERRKELN